MYKTVNFDIVGGCNAKCPLCVTARTTFGKPIQFISIENFTRAIDELIERRLVKKGVTSIHLYNWGEPILHPKLNEIVDVLRERNLQFGISTNASKATSFVNKTDHCQHFIFSVPGFSQDSYDKIHGLKFDKIVRNMKATIINLRDTGYSGPIRLAFHTYKFNIEEELPLAREWCKENGVTLEAYTAYINDYDPMVRYMQGDLYQGEQAYFEENLILDYVDDLVASRPDDWQCPQWKKSLTMNHRSEVMLCCVVPEEHEAYSLGSLYDLSNEQIDHGKTTSTECDTCIGSGVAYWSHNPKKVEYAKRPLSLKHRLQKEIRKLKAG